MNFNLVLDEPAAGDKVEQHDSLQFTADSTLYNDFGPFILSSFRQGEQIYLQLRAEKQSGATGCCDSCSSCG